MRATVSWSGRLTVGENTRPVAAFRKILVANRGEIAIRVFRTLRELGIGAVAVYSEADRERLHVALADEAYLLGPGPATESYLRADTIVEVALRSGADAIHPGYGFLAENADFARRVEEAGLVWIGPPPEAIEAMGSKIAARERMRAAGVPIVPGTTTPPPSVDDVLRRGGGGRLPDRRSRRRPAAAGRGCKVARSADEVERAFEGCAARGRGVLRRRGRVRRALPRGSAARRGAGARRRARQRRPPRRARLHDPAAPPEARRGDAVAGRRRRAPRRASARSRSTRRARSATARPGRSRACSTPDGAYYFLEMNTRVQVEHTVTEAVTGIDIVREQIRVAAGEPLSVTQDGRRASRPRDRVPHQRRGRHALGFLPVAGPDHGLPRARRASACASTPACAPATRSPSCTTR